MNLREKCLWIALVSLLLWSCSSLIVDTSIPAVQAGDYTLALSACENTPGGGFDICRVTAGTPITSSWTLVIPAGKSIVGWEVNVFFKEITTPVTFKGTAPVVSASWAQITGATTWDASMDGEAIALLTVTFKDATGLQSQVEYQGLAKIVVLPANYTRLPIDSGSVAWGTTCKVQYTTAGRGAVSCN